MSQETRGRDSARGIKIASALAMFVAVPGCMAGGAMNSDATMGLFSIIFFCGLVGFIIGRFAE